MVVDDEDEFEEAVVLGHISEVVRLACLAAPSELELRLQGYDELFDRIAWTLLAEAIGLGLPPITHVS